MNDPGRTLRQGRALTIGVLLLLLGATFFISWRQHQVARELQTARWKDGFARLDAVLSPLVDLQSMRDCAKSTLMLDGGTTSAWNRFLLVSEWQKHYPGLQEVGYLEPVTEMNGVKTLHLKFLDRRDIATNETVLDPSTDPLIAGALNNWYNHSNGLASVELTLSFAGPDRLRYQVISFYPLRKRIPSDVQINNVLPSPNGILFLQIDQAKYFLSWQPQLAGQTIDLKLLAYGESDPLRMPLQRIISVRGFSGEWRFLATLKPSPAGVILPQWLLLGGGILLSFFLVWLFSLQIRLRHQAESARENLLARETEITALNRDLEQKIATRTAELNVALAEEKELNRLKTNFTSMVSHEIRTPLEIILSSADILLRYLDRLQPERRTAHLNGIKSAVQRMNELMEDVLLFSRAEAGRMEFNPVALEMGSFCRKLVDEIQSATSHRCPILCSVTGIDGPARADENLLRHIFTNLLSNAVKYSPPGKPVNFSITQIEGDAVFVVQDFGAGIPEVDRRRLFTPFYRGSNVAAIQGTGLGLVIVKHCVERHGGQIEIESAPGTGTKVIVHLPLFSPAHTEFITKITRNHRSE